MTFTVLEAAYHRNGSGPCRGFFVGLVHDTKENATLLITWFPQYKHNGELEPCQEYIAVVDINKATPQPGHGGGNVYMHPTNGKAGGNAWRGEQFGEHARALQKVVNDRHDAERALAAKG